MAAAREMTRSVIDGITIRMKVTERARQAGVRRRRLVAAKTGAPLHEVVEPGRGGMARRTIAAAGPDRSPA